MLVLRRIFPSALKHFLWRKAAERLALNRKLGCGYELQIRSYSDWCLYHDIFAEGEYDAAIHLALRGTAQNSLITVLDLGANVGLFTLRTMELMKPEQRRQSRFILVEPSPSLVARLRETFERGESSCGEINVFAGLVGERSGRDHFQIKHEQIGNAVSPTSNSSTRSIEYLDIERIVGSDCKIRLLKCDIEGSERRFIENYSRLLARTDIAVFEFHEPKFNVNEATARLALAGLGSPRCLRDCGPNQTWCYERPS
jgi:FkbM family methyltransferase